MDQEIRQKNFIRNPQNSRCRHFRRRGIWRVFKGWHLVLERAPKQRGLGWVHMPNRLRRAHIHHIWRYQRPEPVIQNQFILIKPKEPVQQYIHCLWPKWRGRERQIRSHKLWGKQQQPSAIPQEAGRLHGDIRAVLPRHLVRQMDPLDLRDPDKEVLRDPKDPKIVPDHDDLYANLQQVLILRHDLPRS